jgi:hypothetical protein
LRSTQLAATPLGGLTPAEVPLIEAENLSEQPGPPQFYRVIGGLSEGNGDTVLVPADALVYDRVFEAALIVIEAGFSGFHFDEDDFQA